MTITSKGWVAYVIAVITAVVSGNMAGIPTEISLDVAVAILIDHAVMELIPWPSPNSWLIYP